MKPTKGDWRLTLSMVGEKPLIQARWNIHIITLNSYDRVTVQPHIGETMNRGAEVPY
jgi:hypothetical protein